MPNKALQRTAATVIDLPGLDVTAVAAAAELGRSAGETLMSLVVSAFWTDPVTGESQKFTDYDNGHYMAGVECARSELWGSDAVRCRGGMFLPLLADSDLWVGPAELAAFVTEVRALLADLDGLRAELGRGSDCNLPHYLANFLRAAEYAAARDGGVNIT